MKTLYDKRIAEQEASLEATKQALGALKELKKRAGKEKGMDQWLGYPFESSSGLTPEFAQFAKDYKQTLKKMIGADYELLNWSRGHFGVSGFVKNKKTGKIAYFSISDVRFFPDSWYNNILVRTAKHDKDWTGGSNHYSSFDGLLKAFDRLTREVK